MNWESTAQIEHNNPHHDFGLPPRSLTYIRIGVDDIGMRSNSNSH
jgi:hypothetical protein